MARKREAVTIEGARELQEMLRRVIPEEAQRLASSAVFEVAKVVEGRIFRRLQNTSDTGRLAHSLFTRRKMVKDAVASAEVRGGASAPYLLMQEFGTSKTRANPAIVPAVEETRPELPALYRRELGEKLEKAIARKARKGR